MKLKPTSSFLILLVYGGWDGVVFALTLVLNQSLLMINVAPPHQHLEAVK